MGHESEEERWIWLSFATEHRLIPAAYACLMTQKSADIIVEQTCERINEEKLPLFVTDDKKYYKQALLDREGGKVVDIKKCIIFGEEKYIHESLICTSHIGRQNLTSRQENNRLAKKTLGFSKGDEWLQKQTKLQMTYHILCTTTRIL